MTYAGWTERDGRNAVQWLGLSMDAAAEVRFSTEFETNYYWPRKLEALSCSDPASLILSLCKRSYSIPKRSSQFHKCYALGFGLQLKATQDEVASGDLR